MMPSHIEQINLAGTIPKSAYGTCLAVGLIVLAIYVYDQYNFLRYQVAKVLAQRLGYFKDAQGNRMKELSFNSRFLRFSNGHEVSEQGTAIAGDEPYITWNDGKPEVVLSCPNHVKDFYGRETKGHAKPPNMGMGPYFDRVLGSSVGVLNGDKWKTMRKVFDPHLSHQMAMDLRSTFSREVAAWMKDLPSTVAKFGNGVPGSEFVLDASTACRILPFKLVALILYGDALSEAAFEELLQLNALHEKVVFKAFFGKRERSRLFALLPSQSKSQMDEFEREWRVFNLKMIQTAEAEGLSCPVAKMHPSVLNGAITEREFLHTIDEILFANIDVTSSVLAFLLINLARNVPAQTDLRAEVLGHTADPEAYLQKTDTLLEFACMESIRLCPAAWFSLPEYATSDMTVGGYSIPAGTPCIIDWWRLNTQSPVWNSGGVSGTAFSPQRFQRLTLQAYRWSFLRFGLGSRKCIGKNVSGIIMKTFLMAVLKEWELETVGVTKGDEQKMVDTRKDRFTVTPAQSVRFVPI
ncbi:cytochrome P450 [Lindgomyces ingoldianus]|uniref:Cytochrome P450 n=1 Tax=Lindgomyces ingoldianus TaxID=673940 RepID=A0ACB6Q717_9PLEO|nr:cytochrome P450 [Lindgomyces ingoldianus]KAF2462609.1 cytochrome P450 [Lindgomyces ingoldianus]